ncbi:MAG: hypothetical protein IJK59_10690 [Firmicutes bacterium]|nr:hypothetical protein [Bacillota bacterium]MBQ6012423.1 hypothetical protein [Bacillota bacterium]MBQ6261699.1 hypothetical protein [Bacillota bacterium]
MIPELEGVSTAVSKNAPEAFRHEAHRLLDQFRSVKMNRLTDRYQMLDFTSSFLLELGTA